MSELGLLDGVRVVDLTTTFMGPYTTMLMARMGADVIKVEAPGGDVVRGVGTGRHAGMGPLFLSLNHGKRSLELDLAADAGRRALERLVDTADVVVTNMRPQARERLGISADALTAGRPRLVYVTMPGFGTDGPYRERAAYDDVIQCASGLAAVQGGDDEPEYVKTVLADKTVALLALGMINAALLAAARTGRGRVLEIPMFEAMVAFTLVEQQGGHVFDPPIGPFGYERTASVHRRPYATADGHLGVLAYTDRQWRAFFAIAGRPELAQDERFTTITGRTAHIDELYGLVADVLPSRTTAQWVAVLDDAGIPAQPVLSLADVVADPHLAAVGMFEPVEHPTEGALTLPRLPATVDGRTAPPTRPAPRLGEHGFEILAEAGLPPDEIARLAAAGTLGPT